MDTVKWRDGYRQEGCSLFARSVQAACGTLPSLDSNKEEVQPVSLLFLGFQTAAVLAERNARRGFKDFLPSNEVLLSQASRSRTEIISHDLSEYGLTDRGLDVIVPRDASRDPRSPLRYHRGHPLFPSGSFLRGRGGIFIASPALSLLQLSLALDECSWLKLAYRFTGTFSLDESAEDGIVERPPPREYTRIGGLLLLSCRDRHSWSQKVMSTSAASTKRLGISNGVRTRNRPLPATVHVGIWLRSCNAQRPGPL